MFFGRIIAAAGFSITFPFMAVFLHSARGLPMTTVGFILMMAGLMSSLGQLFGGEAADWIGRKRVMCGALGLRGLTILGLAYFAAADAPLAWIVALHMSGAFIGHLFEPASQALVSDYMEPRRRVEAFAFLRTGGNIGWAIGPAVGGFILAFAADPGHPSAGYPLMFALTALGCLVSTALVGAFVQEGSRPPRSSTMSQWSGLGELLRDRLFMGLCLSSLCVYTVMAQFSATLMVYCTTALRLPPSLSGWLFSLNGALVVLLQIPVSRHIARHRLTGALITGALCYTVGYGAVGLAWSLGATPAVFAFLCVCMGVITTGEVFLTPSTVSLAANLSPPDRRGRYQGFFGWSSHLGWCFAPLIGGFAMDVFAESPERVWGVVAAVGLAGTLGYVVLRGAVGMEADRPPSGLLARATAGGDEEAS
ncbi:MAG: MFS transporter [Planctomycetes bacterium]|nr:MFS transporter [Planctomycetota bacterium]